MGTIQDTKIADEPARLWTSMESKNRINRQLMRVSERSRTRMD